MNSRLSQPFFDVTGLLQNGTCFILILVFVLSLPVVFAQQNETSISLSETKIKELLSQANETLKNGNSAY